MVGGMGLIVERNRLIGLLRWSVGEDRFILESDV